MASKCCGEEMRWTPALEILAERFARGETDKAEFEEKRQIIAGLKETDRRNDCCC
jgi:uncharacterized membrane protein